MNISFEGWDVVSVYTRAQALEDGVLVDAGDVAREAGFRFPVALTQAAWALTVALSPAAKRAGQDVSGRLWDVLTLLRVGIGRVSPGTADLMFTVLCSTTRVRPTLLRLRAVIGPGDKGEPVLTIMLPGES
jgi:hypothetical protein